MTIYQRFYIDGKLHKTAKPKDIETARKWLVNLQREWSRNGLFPLTMPGEFDPNNAHKIEVISEDELIVTNTRGKVLRWINVIK